MKSFEIETIRFDKCKRFCKPFRKLGYPFKRFPKQLEIFAYLLQAFTKPLKNLVNMITILRNRIFY